MRSAIAFGAVIVIFGIFMPEVLHAVSTFLLVFFQRGVAMLNALPAQPAMMVH